MTIVLLALLPLEGGYSSKVGFGGVYGDYYYNCGYGYNDYDYYDYNYDDDDSIDSSLRGKRITIA